MHYSASDWTGEMRKHSTEVASVHWTLCSAEDEAETHRPGNGLTREIDCRLYWVNDKINLYLRSITTSRFIGETH